MEMSQVRTIGIGLERPEGVMVLDDGTILTADGRGRCARIDQDGKTSFFGSVGGSPNGICVDANGNCIIANIGNGQVQSLAPDGTHEILLTEVEGKKISSPNFPYIDSKGRLWVSNSSDRSNSRDAIESPGPDGCVVLMEKGVAKIVAENIYFANGITLDEQERYLYVAETSMRDIIRFQISDDGSLGSRETYGPEDFGPNMIPDGIAFDEAGNLWVTFPWMNAIGYISPEGDLKIILEDPEGRILRKPSNICFGWKERKTAFIGSLAGTTIPFFEVPYPGVKLIHQK
jgi:gluconolactonase